MGCGTVGLWDCGTVGLWGCGTVGLWDCGAVGLWDCGAVGLWAVGLWDCGAVGLCPLLFQSRRLETTGIAVGLDSTGFIITLWLATVRLHA